MREDPRLRVFSGVLRRPGTPQWSLGLAWLGEGERDFLVWNGGPISQIPPLQLST